mmetsp:Transcript_4906/g.10024  ORF Transcript_4906/g.10024 Transcript_4906/m.10024 type:complete len:225 (+) Transcript_4906:551-1225(+)
MRRCWHWHLPNRLCRRLRVMRRQLLRALNSLALEHPRACQLNIAGLLEAPDDQRLQPWELLRRVQHRGGGESALQVVVRGLPQHPAGGGEVQQVVHHLEGEAEAAAVLVRQLAGLLAVAAHRGDRLGAVREEAARLVEALLLVAVKVQQPLVRHGRLHHLALHQVVQHGGHQPHRLRALELSEAHRRARQKEISSKNGHLVSHHRVHRSDAAPRKGVVQDIIVQ